MCVNTPGSYQCGCLPGYNRRDSSYCKDIDECEDKTKCYDKRNTMCVNTAGSFQCYCRQGYTRSDNNECVDIDECLQDGICDEKNNTACNNSLGSFTCVCLPGYTSNHTNNTCQAEHSESSLTDPTGGSVGLYVGVTIGVLALLIILVVAIFIRRRRNSKKSSKGTAGFSSRQPETVSLENEEVHVPEETRDEKRISVEYSNHKIPLKKLERSPSSISAEYSNNNKIHSKTDRNGDDIVSSKFTQGKNVSIISQSEGETVYSLQQEHVLPQSIENNSDSSNLDSRAAVNFEDPGAYNTLDSFSLNTNRKPETRQNKAGDVVYSTPFGEPGQPNGNDNLVEISNKATGLKADNSDAYNTLAAFTLNTQNKPNTENKMDEDQNPYNTIPEL